MMNVELIGRLVRFQGDSNDVFKKSEMIPMKQLDVDRTVLAKITSHATEEVMIPPQDSTTSSILSTESGVTLA